MYDSACAARSKVSGSIAKLESGTEKSNNMTVVACRSRVESTLASTLDFAKKIVKCCDRLVVLVYISTLSTCIS
jgi:hypothetical protein